MGVYNEKGGRNLAIMNPMNAKTFFETQALLAKAPKTAATIL